MAIKWSAFASGSAIADANNVVGLQSGANVKWAWSAVKTYILGAATAALAIAAGKTLTVSNSMTLAGTDSTTMTFPTTSATVARTDAGNTFTGNQAATGLVTARSATATPAAASAVAGVAMGSAAVGIYWGTDSPNTVVTAAKGSLYIRTDGSGVGDRMYINTDGVTAWVAFTTAG